jgi:hypothetical protein
MRAASVLACGVPEMILSAYAFCASIQACTRGADEFSSQRYGSGTVTPQYVLFAFVFGVAGGCRDWDAVIPQTCASGTQLQIAAAKMTRSLTEPPFADLAAFFF